MDSFSSGFGAFQLFNWESYFGIYGRGFNLFKFSLCHLDMIVNFWANRLAVFGKIAFFSFYRTGSF